MRSRCHLQIFGWCVLLARACRGSFPISPFHNSSEGACFRFCSCDSERPFVANHRRFWIKGRWPASLAFERRKAVFLRMFSWHGGNLRCFWDLSVWVLTFDCLLVASVLWTAWENVELENILHHAVELCRWSDWRRSFEKWTNETVFLASNVSYLTLFRTWS